MGEVRVKARIRNLSAPGRPREVEAVVDTAATFSSFPASLLKEMGIEPEREVEVEYADGHRTLEPFAALGIEVEGRSGISYAFFGRDDLPPLLGVTALEHLLLGVDPVNGRLFPVPARLYRR